MQGLSYFPVSLYIATFTKSISNQLTATIVLALFNVSAVVGQVLLGHLSDRFPYPWVMFASAIGSGIVAFLLWGLASSATQLYFFAVIFGALVSGFGPRHRHVIAHCLQCLIQSGGFSSTWLNASFDCAGGRPEHAGLALGGTSVFKGISAVVGPIISGLLLEAGRGSSIGGVFGQKGYGAVEIFVGSCAIATSAGSVLVAFISRRAGHAP